MATIWYLSLCFSKLLGSFLSFSPDQYCIYWYAFTKSLFFSWTLLLLIVTSCCRMIWILNKYWMRHFSTQIVTTSPETIIHDRFVLEANNSIINLSKICSDILVTKLLDMSYRAHHMVTHLTKRGIWNNLVFVSPCLFNNLTNFFLYFGSSSFSSNWAT